MPEHGTKTVTESWVDCPGVVDARFGNQPQFENFQSQRVYTSEQTMESGLVRQLAAHDGRSVSGRDKAVIERSGQRLARRSLERKLVHELCHGFLSDRVRNA